MSQKVYFANSMQIRSQFDVTLIDTLKTSLHIWRELREQFNVLIIIN